MRLYGQINIVKRQIEYNKSIGECNKEREQALGFLYYKVGQYYTRKFHKTLGI